jgi:hypothetical protein
MIEFMQILAGVTESILDDVEFTVNMVWLLFWWNVILTITVGGLVVKVDRLCKKSS